MLISMRYIAEKLKIGDDIEMAVVKIKGEQVSVGYAASGMSRCIGKKSISESTSVTHPRAQHGSRSRRTPCRFTALTARFVAHPKLGDLGRGAVSERDTLRTK
ncbi:carbon storage regulator, CsrA [Paraburkholderia aspalathi]|uniref:Carbon storage regulator, CsrA n=1 Tax=Paraburkholderia aspalathi TaxID=1324617 RepID=A0A1I7ACL0_9BURK|nr:carbon storage regulator, CsrA [Paraburkholderia aspalathi]